MKQNFDRRAFIRYSAIAGVVAGGAALEPTIAHAAPNYTNPLGVTAVTVNTSPPTQATIDRDFAAIAASGIRYVRIPIQWTSVEPYRGSRNWAIPKNLVNAANARGLTVLGCLTYVPYWAQNPGVTKGQGAPAAARLGDWASFCTEATRTLPSVKFWEIWNEPNIIASWAPTPSVSAYTALLKASHSALKSVSASNFVITAGTSPTLTGGGQYSPGDFMKGIYSAGGKGFFDATAFHPYNAQGYLSQGTQPYDSKIHIQNIRSSMVANGDTAKRLWSTEFGLPSFKSGSYSFTETDQANWTRDAIVYLRSLPYSGPMFLFDFRDTATGNGVRDENFGLLRSDYSQKPVYAVARSLNT
ncbi:cellulase family glycosylhydrolase [Rhodococcoides trifolii]|nr:cellulase family glycosylhydrolase [Rhodococcus trifolii]